MSNRNENIHNTPVRTIRLHIPGNITDKVPGGNQIAGIALGFIRNSRHTKDNMIDVDIDPCQMRIVLRSVSHTDAVISGVGQWNTTDAVYIPQELYACRGFRKCF
jgi:hypothetical protein